MNRKRQYHEAMANEQNPISPFMPMFEQFRADLDEHHDRRERIIKASRDITAASKKIIFGLQRIRTLKEPISPNVAKSIKQYYDVIKTQLTTIAKDLQGINAYRYSRQISGGLQEFVEAVTFQHYLETQHLMSYQEAQANIEAMTKDWKVMLTVDDYILGLFDMIGELMRFAVTVMATNGELPGKDGRDVLSDLRELRASLENLDTDQSSWFSLDVSKKMPVMQECVEKVEKALYSLTVRGAERPKGWMPDADESRGSREEIESY